MKQEQQQWRKLSGERIEIPITEEVANVLTREKQMGHEMKVCIGTDSQVKGKETEFATVIVFIRKGKGGFMYIHNGITRQKMSIKQRMLMEVSKSIEVASGDDPGTELGSTLAHGLGEGGLFPPGVMDVLELGVGPPRHFQGN